MAAPITEPFETDMRQGVTKAGHDVLDQKDDYLEHYVPPERYVNGFDLPFALGMAFARGRSASDLYDRLRSLSDRRRAAMEASALYLIAAEMMDRGDTL